MTCSDCYSFVPFRQKCCSAKWVGCYVTLSLPVVLSLILLITLSYVPATGNIVHPGIAVQNDTVELQFNLPTWWLSGVTLDIKNACAGSVFSICNKGTTCGALATVVEYLRESFDTHIYMLPTIGVHSSRGLGGRSMHKIYEVRHHHSEQNLNVRLTKGLSGLLVVRLNRWA